MRFGRWGGALCGVGPPWLPWLDELWTGRSLSWRCGFPIWPMSLFRKGKVAVLPSSSESESVFSISIRPSALPSASIISLVRPSSSSSLRPILFITSSTGFMCSSRAHFRQRPSLWDSPFGSMRVINITATFFLQREQRVGCIVKSPVYLENSIAVQGKEKLALHLYEC